MAVGAAGSMENKEMGFTPDESDIITIGGTTVGYLQDDIVIEAPFDRAFVMGGLVPIKTAKVTQGLNLTFTCQETLLENASWAWDVADVAAGVVTIDEVQNTTQAILVNVPPPNFTTGDTRVFSMPKGLSNGPGTLTFPKAGAGETNQMQAQNFSALGDPASSPVGLLGTLTDAYV